MRVQGVSFWWSLLLAMTCCVSRDLANLCPSFRPKTCGCDVINNSCSPQGDSSQCVKTAPTCDGHYTRHVLHTDGGQRPDTLHVTVTNKSSVTSHNVTFSLSFNTSVSVYQYEVSLEGHFIAESVYQRRGFADYFILDPPSGHAQMTLDMNCSCDVTLAVLDVTVTAVHDPSDLCDVTQTTQSVLGDKVELVTARYQEVDRQEDGPMLTLQVSGHYQFSSADLGYVSQQQDCTCTPNVTYSSQAKLPVPRPQAACQAYFLDVHLKNGTTQIVLKFFFMLANTSLSEQTQQGTSSPSSDGQQLQQPQLPVSSGSPSYTQPPSLSPIPSSSERTDVTEHVMSHSSTLTPMASVNSPIFHDKPRLSSPSSAPSASASPAHMNSQLPHTGTQPGDFSSTPARSTSAREDKGGDGVSERGVSRRGGSVTTPLIVVPVLLAAVLAAILAVRETWRRHRKKYRLARPESRHSARQVQGDGESYRMMQRGSPGHQPWPQQASQPPCYPGCVCNGSGCTPSLPLSLCRTPIVLLYCAHDPQHVSRVRQLRHWLHFKMPNDVAIFDVAVPDVSAQEELRARFSQGAGVKVVVVVSGGVRDILCGRSEHSGTWQHLILHEVGQHASLYLAVRLRGEPLTPQDLRFFNTCFSPETTYVIKDWHSEELDSLVEELCQPDVTSLLSAPSLISSDVTSTDIRAAFHRLNDANSDWNNC